MLHIMIKRVNTRLLIRTPRRHSISDLSFSVFLSLLSVSLLLNWVPLFTAFKISTHKCSCKGKLSFIQTASNLGTWWVSQIRSVAQSCPTLCDPMNHSTPGLPVHHQLPEFTQTHVHRVGDAIQPSHPLSSPSPPAPNPSQHQSLFQ